MFVLQSMPRCGAHLIVTALRQHPEVVCYGEVLNPFSAEHGFPELNPTASEVLRHCKSQAKPTGFVAHAYVGLGAYEQGDGLDKQFRSHPTVRNSLGFWGNLPKNCHVITLRRKNLLERYVSQELAAKRDAWKVQVGDPMLPPTVLTVNIDDMLKDFARTESLYRIGEKRFPNALVIYCEDLVKDTKNALEEIQLYLGVSVLDLKPTTVKVGRSMRETLVNYTAVHDAIRGTKYEQFLD